MNCHQCAKFHKFVGDSLVIIAPDRRLLFCDYVCLRAWMRMPPSLTDEKPEPENVGPSPLHVVFDYLLKIADAHERYPRMDFSTIIRGVLAGNLDR